MSDHPTLFILSFWYFSLEVLLDSIQDFRCACTFNLHSFHGYWSKNDVQFDLDEKEVVLLFTLVLVIVSIQQVVSEPD